MATLAAKAAGGGAGGRAIGDHPEGGADHGARRPLRRLRQLGQGQRDDPQVDVAEDRSRIDEALELIAEREGRPARPGKSAKPKGKTAASKSKAAAPRSKAPAKAAETAKAAAPVAKSSATKTAKTAPAAKAKSAATKAKPAAAKTKSAPTKATRKA